jgi:hypothetical protein
MGRKSSAKSQSKPASAPSGLSGSPGAPRSGGPLKLAAMAAGVLAIGVAIYVIGSRPAPAAVQAPSAPAVASVPESAAQGPHPQANLPPLPFDPEPPARSPEVVRAAYKFAAEHSEVLSYVPCYCGCERSGHRGNEDCFVTQRDAKGDVTQWEPHGMT